MTNRVETGFDSKQLFELLDVFTFRWAEKERLDILLLRAICQLSAANPAQAGEGFTSQDIVEAISRIRGHSWSSGDDKSQMSDDVRKQWNKLTVTWENKQEGIDQHFGDCGYPIPRLGKTEGGGTGRPSRYRIDWRPTTPPSATDSNQSVPGAHELPSGWVRYICDDIEDAGMIARIFAKGYVMAGWKRRLFVTFLAVPLLILFLVFIYALFGITYWSAIGTRIALNSLLPFIVIYIAAYLTIGPILSLATDKIVTAPWWLQSTASDRLLEFRSQPRYPEKSIKAVRYTGICPICNGQVTTHESWFEFRGRIVGRCENTPKEHVFSFDHVMRSGYPLRTNELG